MEKNHIFLSIWNIADIQPIMPFQLYNQGNWSFSGTMDYCWSAKILLSRAFNWWDVLYELWESYTLDML